ncbi:hypothetical protein ENHYDAX1_200107 [Enhydrobacter sp. AX1]|nr:hypothetical protein ENHYDAX1_200107 [Enhydrobacter sp. AX1]
MNFLLIKLLFSSFNISSFNMLLTGHYKIFCNICSERIVEKG